MLPAPSLPLLSTDMENSSETSLVQYTGIAKTRKDRKEDIANPAESAFSSLKLAEAKGNKTSDEGIYPKVASVPVLAERNMENNVTIANSTSKMVSPVLLKLRRNQEKKVIPANPVDPVQVPPKPFLGFPAERLGPYHDIFYSIHVCTSLHVILWPLPSYALICEALNGWDLLPG